MAALAFRRQLLESVDSSNNVIKQALEAGEPEGLAVQARVQTGGYGRQGRGWQSPRGGMYLSLLLRPQVPPAQLPTLSLVTGLAVRDALRSLVTAEEARRIVVKWPNDVVYDEGQQVSPAFAMTTAAAGSAQPPASPLDKTLLRKMCGISLESHGGGICIGIGVNVHPPLPAPASNSVAAAAPMTGNRSLYLAELGYGHTCQQDAAVDAVAEAVLQHFAHRYQQWLAGGFAPLLPEFSEGDPLRGKQLAVVNMEGASLAEGIAQGVDDYGRLLVRSEDAVVPVHSGEAHLL